MIICNNKLNHVMVRFTWDWHQKTQTIILDVEPTFSFRLLPGAEVLLLLASFHYHCTQKQFSLVFLSVPASCLLPWAYLNLRVCYASYVDFHNFSLAKACHSSTARTLQNSMSKYSKCLIIIILIFIQIPAIIHSEPCLLCKRQWKRAW